MSASGINSCVICVSPTCKRFTPHAVTGAALPDKLRGLENRRRKTRMRYEQPPSSPSLGEGEERVAVMLWFDHWVNVSANWCLAF